VSNTAWVIVHGPGTQYQFREHTMLEAAYGGFDTEHFSGPHIYIMVGFHSRAKQQDCRRTLLRHSLSDVSLASFVQAPAEADSLARIQSLRGAALEGSMQALCRCPHPMATFFGRGSLVTFYHRSMELELCAEGVTTCAFHFSRSVL
jgi:hypothetical protein